MSIWNLIILSGVAAAAFVSWGKTRYLSWIAIIFASYAISVVYWDFHGPYAEFVAGASDMAIVGLIAWKARYLWELWVAAFFLTSAFTNLTYLASNLIASSFINHATYSSILEAINILAILLIGGVASFDKAGMVNGLAFRPWVHVFGRVRLAYARRDPRA